MAGAGGNGERRNSFEMERKKEAATGFSREDKMAAMHKSFSTGNLTSTLSGLQLLQPEPECSEAATAFFHKQTGEHRIRIEFEGDGPLGIGFAEADDGEIVVTSIQKGTACSEFPELETELVLREIDGSPAAAHGSFRAAMRAISTSWQQDSAVALVFARPQVRAPPPTAVGRPSLAGMVKLKDDGVGSLEHMSPIHEAHRKGATPRMQPSVHRVQASPPQLCLGGVEPQATETRVETKRERQLREVRKFLCDLKVDSFMDAFVEFGVSSMEDLKFIEPTDLPGFGLKPLQQRRVATALAQLQDGAVDAPALAARDGMGRSPSQVFEMDALDPPALALDNGSDADGDVNVFISPFLAPAAVEQEAARIREEAAKLPGVARLHTFQGDSAVWSEGSDEI